MQLQSDQFRNATMAETDSKLDYSEYSSFKIHQALVGVGFSKIWPDPVGLGKSASNACIMAKVLFNLYYSL